MWVMSVCATRQLEVSFLSGLHAHISTSFGTSGTYAYSFVLNCFFDKVLGHFVASIQLVQFVTMMATSDAHLHEKRLQLAVSSA